MNSKDLPTPPRAVIPTTAIPLIAIPGTTLFPGTLLPLHAWEAGPCRQLADSLADRRLLALAGAPFEGTDAEADADGALLNELGASRSRAPRVVGLGRAVSDRRYPDGRIDVFVHGVARAQVERITLGQAGLLADLTILHDRAERPLEPAALRLLTVARLFSAAAPEEEAMAMESLVGSSQDPALVSNRIAAGFIESYTLRQRLLETTCPTHRCELLVEHLAGRLLSLAPAPRGALH